MRSRFKGVNFPVLRALGIVFVLDRGMLTVALALAAFGAAIVESRLSIPALR
jgi:hypothetical protein